MDQTTHEIRLANWTANIEQCQTRPTDQTAKQWLAENNIPEKQYNHWLHRVRKAALGENQTTQALGKKQLPEVPSTRSRHRMSCRTEGFPQSLLKRRSR